MKKRILTLALALVIVLSISAIPAFAAPSSGVKVLLDGNLMTFDVPPQIINNRTMVPLRAIFEAMGAKVDWVGETQTVTGTKDDTVVILKIGDTSPTINGIVVPIDQPAVIKENRTLAPLRFVAEAFGGTVDWEGSTQTASITMGDAEGASPETTPETTEPPTTTPPSGSVDTRLVGNYWYYNDTSINRTYFYYFFFFFTAKFYEIHGGLTIVEAKFTTVNGKIYLTESYYVYEDLAGDGKPYREKTLHGNGNKTIEYAIGTDEKGAYLQIANVVGVSEHSELPASPRKFRMAFEHDAPWE
jgi:hypothetical protein